MCLERRVDQVLTRSREPVWLDSLRDHHLSVDRDKISSWCSTAIYGKNSNNKTECYVVKNYPLWKEGRRRSKKEMLSPAESIKNPRPYRGGNASDILVAHGSTSIIWVFAVLRTQVPYSLSPHTYWSCLGLFLFLSRVVCSQFAKNLLIPRLRSL